jgi:hypothetical protein
MWIRPIIGNQKQNIWLSVFRNEKTAPDKKEGEG